MLTTIANDVTVTFNGTPYTGAIQYDPEAHLLNLVHPNGEDEVLSASFDSQGLVPAANTVFVHDGGVRSGLAHSLERAEVIEILRTIQIGFDVRAVEARVLAAGSALGSVIDRVATKSGSVYEFAWGANVWPARGTREGHVRKNGGEWAPIRMITFGFEVGARMTWVQPDESTVTTTRIVSAEAITDNAAHAA